MPVTTAGVLLAAGAGKRFAGDAHKLRSLIGGRAVLSIALASLIEAGLDETVIVTGAVDLTDLVSASVTSINNPSWSLGQATSLWAAVCHCRERGHDAMVVGLGDQPGILPETWAKLAASDATIGVATYEGKRRNPVRLTAEVWDLLPRDGDEGARSLIESRPDLVMAIPCVGRADDIDTLEDLRRWS